ncbi:MAG TPA: PH domain-containing protein [Pseudonocardia sp.]|jgi:membrane protein YdbS with pleckstrin-like domain|nr:PH domain-containing protein [Pseudonocardia sp.]
MAYPDDLLVAGEEVVVHEHPHGKVLLGPVLWFLGTVGVLTYLAALVRAETWAPWAWLGLGVLGLVLVVWLTIVPVARWRSTHFVVTTRRVLVREGVLSRQGIDIPMSRINSVRFRHSMLERLLGCGTLIIESASDEPLEFDDVPDVERVHALLHHEAADDT